MWPLPIVLRLNNCSPPFFDENNKADVAAVPAMVMLLSDQDPPLLYLHAPPQSIRFV